MSELLTDFAPISVIYSVGDRVTIARGPLKGLAGRIAEIDGQEVLVDLRDACNGLLVRCPANQLAAA
jgi:transcription antitermination factor NusG